MGYASKSDLVPKRMSTSDLAELTSDTGTVDDEVVQGALDDASSKVDSYCGQRYKTPLQPSSMVLQLVLDLAIFDLASRRRDTQPSETWTQRYEMAMSMLKDISSGKASLDQPVDAAPQQSSSGPTVSCKPQTFNDDNLSGFC